MNYKEQLIRALEAKEIFYTEHDEFHLDVSYRAENADVIRVDVVFDNDGSNHVALRCWSFGKTKRREAVIDACNTMNHRYRWVKFFVDDENDVTASIDAIVTPESVGDVCIELIRRMVDIFDEAYPELMKTAWA